MICLHILRSGAQAQDKRRLGYLLGLRRYLLLGPINGPLFQAVALFLRCPAKRLLISKPEGERIAIFSGRLQFALESRYRLPAAGELHIEECEWNREKEQ